jgi:cytochrome c5
VSNKDSQFLNTFSVVIGLLAVVAIVLLAMARGIANRTQVPGTYADPVYVKEVAENTRPFARVAIAGQDNAALVIAERAALPVAAATDAAAAAASAPAPKMDGTAVYEVACKVCHGTGLAGAPHAGDKADWAPRIAQGKDTLYEHAIKGYTGKTGVMPPKGGRTDLSDELVRESVDHMVSLVN